MAQVKGVTVGTLHHGRISFMGTNIDLRKRAEILGFAVICALGNGAADALVCVHLSHLTFCDIDFIICRKSVVILICKKGLKERIFP